MSEESQNMDRKSLRIVTDRTANWKALAKDCVCFANATGGSILIGVEDGATEPPVGQSIPKNLPVKIRKRIGELTVNVTIMTEVKTASNGAEYIELRVSRSHSPASTTEGRYFIRVSDECKPLIGDDILRLLEERSAQPWETLTTLGVSRKKVDKNKLEVFADGIRRSSRVKDSVKEKTDQELLDHYLMSEDQHLTNLGILLIGTRVDRAKLGTAPLVHFIKYDEQIQKVNKIPWDDYSLSPLELITTIWKEIPDFREHYEVSLGLFQQSVPAFDEKVVRELLVNAMVHRPYIQRGDIFLNLYPDRLEIINPGRLPLGVTPQNILHASRRRNDGLARIFHDLHLMEREGSGFDLIYERLLTAGRPVPSVTEGVDSVCVSIQRPIAKPEIIRFLNEIEKRYQLKQRERIALGLLAQTEGLSARELVRELELSSIEKLRPWLGRLVDMEIIKSAGRTQAKHYFVSPEQLNIAGIHVKTTLRRIEPHRLSQLILEDIQRYPGSRIGEIHQRIGKEINRSMLKRALANLVEANKIVMDGVRSGARYRLPD